MTHAQRTAREQVGDGKLPNLYWVCTHYGWLEASKPGHYDWAEDIHPELNKLPKPKTETFGPYKTFAGAMEKVEEIITNEITEPDGITLGIHGVSVEDRLAGVIYEATYYVTPTKKGIYHTTSIEFERNDDTRYTRKKMEELGEAFA